MADRETPPFKNEDTDSIEDSFETDPSNSDYLGVTNLTDILLPDEQGEYLTSYYQLLTAIEQGSVYTRSASEITDRFNNTPDKYPAEYALSINGSETRASQITLVNKDGPNLKPTEWAEQEIDDINSDLGDLNESIPDDQDLAEHIEEINEDIEESAPHGLISMWSGSVGDIPDGWTLCDGSNGAPDLRDRFIVGAGGSYSPDETGGEEFVGLSESEMPSHTHSGNGSTSRTGSHSHNVSGNTGNSGNHSHNVSGNTNNTGSHSHNINFIRTSASGSGDPPQSADGGGNYNMNTGSAGSHSHNISGNTSNTGSHSHNISGNTSNTGSHSHNVSVSVGSTGGGQSHENRPPYYSLAYIMKL